MIAIANIAVILIVLIKKTTAVRFNEQITYRYESSLPLLIILLDRYIRSGISLLA